MKKDVPSQVLNKIMNQGYEDLVVDVFMEMQENNDYEVSDIPISPKIINNNDEQVILHKNVYETYLKLVHRISNPETAEEVPFFLVGNSRFIDGKKIVEYEDIIYSIDDALSETRVSADDDKFNELLRDGRYNTISIGHTHGNVRAEIKEKALAANLSQELKETYGIRATGLNVSISDIWQHEYYKQVAEQVTKGGKQVYQTIIMYNGDFVTIGSKEISKSSNIKVKHRNDITIHCGDEQTIVKNQRAIDEDVEER